MNAPMGPGAAGSRDLLRFLEHPGTAIVDRHGWRVPPRLALRALAVRAACAVGRTATWTIAHHRVASPDGTPTAAFAGSRTRPADGGGPPVRVLELADATVEAHHRIESCLLRIHARRSPRKERLGGSWPAAGTTTRISQHPPYDGIKARHADVAGGGAWTEGLLDLAADLADMAPMMAEADGTSLHVDTLQLETGGDADHLSFLFHQGWRQVDTVEGGVAPWFREAVQTLEANMQTERRRGGWASTCERMRTFDKARPARSATLGAAADLTRSAKARALAGRLVAMGAPPHGHLAMLADGRMPVEAMDDRWWRPA